MSLCWNVFSKVPWSCWYCECYLNDSFEFLRTTQLRNTLFCFSIIIFLKFLVWGAKKKDVEQQIAFEWNHTIAAVFCFMGWSQTCANGMVFPDMHRVILDCLRHSCKGHFMKNTNLCLSLIGNRKTVLLIWCLFLCCWYTFYK